MTSEIRANTLKNRVGLGTVSFTNTGPVVSGIVTANTLRLPDATSGSLGRLQLGNGLYFSMYHDGTNSHIVNNNGYLTIQSQAGVNGIFIARNAEVNLYYGPSVRLQTSSVGVTINRDLDVDGHTNLDNVSIAGVTTFAGAIDANGDLDVDGHTNLDNVNIAGVTTMSGNLSMGETLTVSGNNPNITLTDTNSNPDFKIYGSNGAFSILDSTNSVNRFVISSTGNISISNDLDVDGHTNLDNVSIAGVTTTAGTFNAANIVQVGTTNESGELRIGHDGSNYRARIVSNSSNSLEIDADGPERIQMHGGVIYMRPLNSEKSAAFVANGPAELYHNDIKTAFTSLDGWNVYGRTSNSGMVEIASNQGANNNDRFRIHKTSAASRLTIQNYSSGSWVENIRITAGNMVELKHADGTTKFQTTSTGVSVTNRITAGGDSNTYMNLGPNDIIDLYTGGTNLIRMDASGRLLVGDANATGAAIVQVQKTSGDMLLVRNHATNYESLILSVASGTADIYASSGGSTARPDLRFITNDAERLRIETGGNIRLLSENGNNSDTPGIYFRGGSSSQKANFAKIHSRMVSNWGGQLQFKVKNDNGSLSDAYQTAMIMDHNGAVTKPNTVAFHATHAGNQSLGSGDTITTWSTTNSHRGHAQGGASISSGVFTAPVTGIYVFHAQFLLSGATNTTGIHMVWKKNNSTFTYFNSRFNGNQIGYGGYVPICGQTTMHLDANENCRITISFGGTAPSVYGTDYNWGFWDGYLLG